MYIYFYFFWGGGGGHRNLTICHTSINARSVPRFKQKESIYIRIHSEIYYRRAKDNIVGIYLLLVDKYKHGVSCRE